MKITINKKGFYIIQLNEKEKAIIKGTPKNDSALLEYNSNNTIQTQSITVSGLQAGVNE